MQMVLVLVSLVLYGGLMYGITRMKVSRDPGASEYLVAGRQVGNVQGALSIAATWIWAPALFIASTQAYNNGWVGVFWFVVPNVLTLLLMIPFAIKVRQRYPGGFTLSGFMRKRYGRPVQGLYLFEMGTLSTLSISVNLLAGGTVLSILSGLPLIVSTVVLLAIALGYTYRYGIASSYLTDAVQMLLILGMLAFLVPGALAITGADALAAGINGINNITSPFDSAGVGLAVSFGIISAIGLAAGPVGDQAFWQRAFSLKKTNIAKSFGFGALVFGVVPLSMAVFGFLAAGSGQTVGDDGYVNLEVIQSIFPAWVTVPFLIMLLSGLLSTVDSQMLALSSLSSDRTASLRVQRLVLLGGSVLALGIANLPGNSVATMFLIYGTVRSTTFLITLPTIAGARFHARSVAVGIAAAMVIGFPLAFYGNLVNPETSVKLVAILTTTVLSVAVAYVGTLIFGRSPASGMEPDHQTPSEQLESREKEMEMTP